MFTSHDHQFIQSIANRIIEISPNGTIDKKTDYDSYREDNNLTERRSELYKGFKLDA
jgi:ATPase subunit of ABC transporter with duplicated ATPase domains